MRNNQQGFSLGEILLIIVIAGAIGVGGFITYQRIQQPAPAAVAPAKSDASAKGEWRTITAAGMAVTYPVAWDAGSSENYKPVTLSGQIEGDTIHVGFGTPRGFKYLGGDSWQFVDENSAPVEGYEDDKPMAAPAKVKGAESTVLIGGGDGGCGGQKIAIAYKGALYTVSLPRVCEPGSGFEGPTAEAISKDLPAVIKSIGIY